MSNLDAVHRSVDSFNDPQRRESYFDLYDRNCVLHYPKVSPGLDGIKQFYGMFWAAFPDVSLRIEDILEQGDKAAARFAFTATHSGDFMGIPPTGRKVNVEGITILHFRDGKCVERWSEMNLVSLLQQLGAMPA